MVRNPRLVGSAMVAALVACSGGGGGGGGGGGSHTLTVHVAGSGSGRVTSAPAGIDCSSATCSASFPHGTVVTLTPAAAGTSLLAGWSGACGGTGPCSFTMNGDVSVTATFDVAPVLHTLSVTLGGTGSGGVSSSPPGIICSSGGGGACSASFAEGTSVTLTAEPAPGGTTFAGWGGACASAVGTTCTLSMSADASASASFDPPAMRTLEVIVTGSGSGTVQSSPGGIVCTSGTCTADFPQGTEVTLTATPANDGSTFAGWAAAGACGSAGTGACTLTLNGNASATATFDPPPVLRTLTVTIAGQGSGSVTYSPGNVTWTSGTHSATFADGAMVTLTATPAGPGHEFTGWAGACESAGTGTCTLTLSADASVTATFSTLQTVHVTIAGDGTGTVTSQPPGIDCTTGSTSGCSATFRSGSWVTLTATAAAGSSFYGWSPMCDGSPEPCSFNIGSTANVTATFPAWAVRRPFPNTVKGVGALGSTLVAVGTGGRVVTSADGLAWTGHELANTRNQLRAVAADAGGTTAVAVGDVGTILTTVDGVAWTSRTSNTAATLTAAAHGGGAFVAVGYTGTVLSSADGATWQARTSETVYDLLSVAYGSGRFVAVGYGGTVLTSADGQSWAKVGTGLTTQVLTGVAYDVSSGFVAVGSTGAVLTSSNGSDWTLQGASKIPVSGQTTVVGVAAGSGTFVAVDSAHAVHRSTSGGTSWATNAATEDLEGSGGVAIASAGGAFFATSDAGISRSTDGIAWTRVLTLRAVFYGMAYGASTYVLVGHGVILTSPDGAEWTSRFAGNPYLRYSDLVTSVVYANGTFIAVSGHGILASTDGASWTVVGAAPSQYGGVVAYGAGQGFVVLSQSNTASDVWTSPDGTTWTKQAGTGIASPLSGIAWGASTFVAVGGWNNSVIYTNPTPGSTPAWTQQSSPTSDMLGSVRFGNGTFVTIDVQSGQDAFTSTNTVQWSGPHHAPSWMGQLIAFGDGVFVTQQLLTSPDGQAWTLMQFRPPGMATVSAGTRGPDRWVLATGTGGVGADSGTYVFGVHP